MPRLINVIQNHKTKGTGKDFSPYRLVYQVFDTDGMLLAEYDSNVELILKTNIEALKKHGCTEEVKATEQLLKEIYK